MSTNTIPAMDYADYCTVLLNSVNRSISTMTDRREVNHERDHLKVITVNSFFSRVFYFRETSRVQSFVKIKPSRKYEITLRFIVLIHHTGQCKRTGGCYNELVVAFFSTGGGVKGKKNLYPLTLLFICKLAFILFVMTPGAQTTGNIAVYGSVKQLVI